MTAPAMRVAMGLRDYKAQHGKYPETLDSLVPNFIDGIPTDPFANRPFVYMTWANGYFLFLDPGPEAEIEDYDPEVH